jgi:hypothetical protein
MMETETLRQVLEARETRSLTVPIRDLHISFRSIVEVQGRPFLLDPLAAWKLSRLIFAAEHGLHFGQTDLLDERLGTTEGNVVLRVRGETVVGVVSGRYAPVADLDLLDILVRAIRGTEFHVSDFQCETHLSRFTFLDRRALTEVRPGDTIAGGFTVINSETGLSSLKLRGFLYRLICSNGAVISHGIPSVSIVHRAAHPLALVARFREALPRVMAQVAVHLDAIPRLTKSRLSSDSLKAIGTDLCRYLTRGGVDLVLETLPRRPTVYDAFNRVTAYARTRSFSTRLRLERYAGQMLEPYLASAA